MQVFLGLIRLINFDIELEQRSDMDTKRMLMATVKFRLTHLLTLFVFVSLVYAGDRKALELIMIRAALVK